MADAPFPIHPTYTGISIAFQNAELIADQVLPRATPVGTKEFRYNVYPIDEVTRVPDLRMGRRSEANTIELTATETPQKVSDYGLSDVVPNDDISNAPQGYDPLGHATETVTDLILLGREVRVAGLVFNANSYPAGNKQALAGAGQWSDPASDPFQDQWDALEIPTMRPNTIIYGRPVWNKIATHPKVITKLYGVGSQRGKARIQDLADELEVDKIIIGNARVNVAARGQQANLQRAWGKAAAMLYINPLANNERGMTFGMTVPKGTRATRIIPEPKIGIGGSQRVQVEEQLAEVIVASSCGYFFDTAVA